MMRGVSLFSVGLQLALLVDGVRADAFKCDAKFGTADADKWMNGLIEAVSPSATKVDQTKLPPLPDTGFWAYVVDKDIGSNPGHTGSCKACTSDGTTACTGETFADKWVCHTDDPSMILCDWTQNRVKMVGYQSDGKTATTGADAVYVTSAHFLSDYKWPSEPSTAVGTAVPGGGKNVGPSVDQFKACWELQHKSKCGCCGEAPITSYTAIKTGDACATLRSALKVSETASSTHVGKPNPDTYTDKMINTQEGPASSESFAQLATDACSWVAITGAALAVPALGYAAYNLGPKFFAHAETEETHESTVQSKQEGYHAQEQPAQTLAEPAYAVGALVLVILGFVFALVSLGGGKTGARPEEDFSDEEDKA